MVSICLIKIFRYYFPSDLPEKFNKFFEIFSHYEVFLTELLTVLFVDMIVGKCQVLNYEHFDKL